MPPTRYVAAFSAALIGLTLAACDDSTAPVNNQTEIKLVNVIQNAVGSNSANVSMSINGLVVQPTLGGAGFTNCQVVNPGTFTLGVAQVTPSVTLLTVPNVPLVDRGKYVFFATGTVANPTYSLLLDNYSAPVNGRAKIRIFNALPAGGNVDAYIGAPGSSLGVANATNVPFNTGQSYIDVPTGQTEVRFTNTGTQNVIATTGSFNVSNQWVITVVVSEKNSGGTPYRTFVVPSCY